MKKYDVYLGIIRSLWVCKNLDFCLSSLGHWKFPEFGSGWNYWWAVQGFSRFGEPSWVAQPSSFLKHSLGLCVLCSKTVDVICQQWYIYTSTKFQTLTLSLHTGELFQGTCFSILSWVTKVYSSAEVFYWLAIFYFLSFWKWRLWRLFLVFLVL